MGPNKNVNQLDLKQQNISDTLAQNNNLIESKQKTNNILNPT